ncbi:hypothetical protein MKX03_022146 [Papaver bracteatum]|nr:hypothetical protein MKX03_022146 [Papaver bracteatum]
MKFHVIDASLKEFYLTNDDILHYNFAVTISVGNSNKVARISYSDIRSKIYCYGEDLGFVPMNMSFWQGPKNTTLLHPVFHGQTMFKLRGSRLEDFSDGQRDGSYIIYVYLYLTIQMKHAGGGKSLEEDYIIECGLHELHLLGSSSSFSNNQTGIGDLFKTKRCGELHRAKNSQHMKFYVNDASLTEFYLTNEDVLHYNLAVNISARNSNKIERISYSSILSKMSCYGKYLALVSLLSFGQGTKSTALLHPVFQGQTFYTINVDLYLRTQLKHAGGGKGSKIYYSVKCGLFRIQLLGSPSSSNNQEQIGGSFKTKKCETYQ